MNKKKLKVWKSFNLITSHRVLLLQLGLIVFILIIFFQVQHVDVASINKTAIPTFTITSPTPTVSATPSPSPTMTPTPTSTPIPTSTPKQEKRSSKNNSSSPTPTPIVIQVQSSQHYGCTENGACVLMQGSGNSECSKDYHCKHYACLNNSCALVPGKGANSCDEIGSIGYSDDDWNTVFSRSCAHLACVDKACKIVPGVGADECRRSTDCQ